MPTLFEAWSDLGPAERERIRGMFDKVISNECWTAFETSGEVNSTNLQFTDEYEVVWAIRVVANSASNPRKFTVSLELEDI